LVLIDGWCIAPYPIGNGAPSSFFDLRPFRKRRLRVSILKTATYGADAMRASSTSSYARIKGAEASIDTHDDRFWRASCVLILG
jgi:hypothetical protein